jgi:hypothetical protein
MDTLRKSYYAGSIRRAIVAKGVLIFRDPARAEWHAELNGSAVPNFLKYKPSGANAVTGDVES